MQNILTKAYAQYNPSIAGPIWVQTLSTLSLQDVLAPTGVTKSAGTKPNKTFSIFRSSSSDFQWFSVTLPTRWRYSKGWIRSREISRYFEFSVTMLTSYCRLAPSHISLIVWLKSWRIIIRFHLSNENPETWFVKFIATFCVCSVGVKYIVFHRPLARYVKLRVAHAPRMPETFSPLPQVNDPATHVPWCIPRSLISGLFWSRWRGKRSRHSRCMRNAQFCVSGKRPIALYQLHSRDKR